MSNRLGEINVSVVSNFPVYMSSDNSKNYYQGQNSLA